MPDPIHIHATAPLAERVLLPGDPGRALALAQSLLSAPKMFNHNRGLWGYTGEAVADGLPLTIQSTGMGGPSAAIVISELAELGARTFVRVGTCGSLTAELGLGELVIVTDAICEDGASRALTSAERVAPEPDLLARLVVAAETVAAEPAVAVRQGVVVSTDLLYDRPAGARDRWVQLGAAAVELETATVLALARRRGLSAAAVLLVADVIGTRREPTPTRTRASARGRAAPRPARGPGAVSLRTRALGWPRRPRARRLAASAATAVCAASSRSSVRSMLVRRSSSELFAGGRCKPVVEAVDAVLDALQPLRNASHASGEALQVARRREVQRPHRHFLRAHRALARLEHP